MTIVQKRHQMTVMLGKDSLGEPVIHVTLIRHGEPAEAFRVYGEDTFYLDDIIDIDERCLDDAEIKGWEVVR